MNARNAVYLAVSLALGFAAPVAIAQGQKPAVTNPAASKAKNQASDDDLLAGRKAAPGTVKKGSAQQMGQGQGQEPNTPQTASRKAQMGSGQGQQGPGQRKAQAMGQGQGQEPNTPQAASRKAHMGSGQGQQGPGQRKAQAMGQGQGQEPNTPQAASRKAQMGDGQGQQGFGGQRQMQMQGSKGIAGGGEQFHKGGAAAQSKAAQMHK